MSKVEIAGPRALLERVLYLLQETGLLQIEPSTKGFIEKKDAVHIDSFLPDKDRVSERFFLEEVRGNIDELFSFLRKIPDARRTLDPRPIIDSIHDTLQRHLESCREKFEKKQALKKELEDLDQYNVFLDSVETLLEGLHRTPDTEFIGLTLRDPDAVEILRKFLARQAEGKYDLRTSLTADGSIVGLIAVKKEVSDKIKTTLSDKDIPELRFPFSFEGLTFFQKIELLRKRMYEIESEIESLDMQLDSFAMKWGAIYLRVKEWIEESLSVLNAAGSVFETRMCFLIYGWMASEDVEKLGGQLTRTFKGEVVLEEIEVREEDLDRMPVILKNPPYFKPFELFTRILPLPRYSSYDPTPFIGIFFPIFFGMILGDAGYALLLLPFSLFMLKKFRKKKIIPDASKILFLSSLYALVFGIIYGEFFGDVGHRLFHLQPLFVERRTAIIPMLYFAVTVGVVHIVIGSFLGIASALKRKTKREAIGKCINLTMIICILLLIATMFGLFPSLLTRPMILAIFFLTPFLLFAGGLLAPLELLKSLGNIISYARIMAIGLTSVLLAFVANRLAGMTGDIITGIVVASLLHLLNIIIGVFSPTIHSLRLHYVEFFSKFLESGGRKFEPFKKKEVL